MDGLSFGIAMGNKYRADGAESGLQSALEACQIHERTIAELQKQLRIEKATSAAHKAVVDEFKLAHASSPLLAVIGKRLDGKPLTKSTSIWMKAFDKAADVVGLLHPEKHRIA